VSNIRKSLAVLVGGSIFLAVVFSLFVNWVLKAENAQYERRNKDLPK
jgi:hypothetical protein